MNLLKKSAIAVVFLYFVLSFFDMDDHLISKATYFLNKITGKKSLNLDKYKVLIEAKKVAKIDKNLSGITYNSSTKTLFAIQNSPRNIYELSLNGEYIRTIKLHGFKDTEGISYISEKTFSIIDEKLKEISLIEIDVNTKEIHRKDIKYKFKIDNNSFENFSYEGIAYNKNKDEFYIVNEKFPVETITVSNWLSNNVLSINFDNNFSAGTSFVSDLSGIHYNSNLNNVLLLSDESMLLTELDLEGNNLSFMDLEKGFLELKNDIPQAEGITLDENNNIYIVSEPNLFYKFSKDKK